RRWVTTDRFDYAEGFHTHGWFPPGRHVEGKQTRQIIFVKGTNPPETSYWVVLDTVEPADDQEHQYQALFHSRRNHAGVVDDKSKTVHCWDAGAALRIIPAVTDGLDIELIHGQTEPHIQGWHVVGENRAAMWTPTFQWKATGTTTRAWVLVPAGPDQKWCVDQVELQQADANALVFRCLRPDGGSDLVYRRPESQRETITIEGTELQGDVGVVSFDTDGKEHARFTAPEKP
ncbi:MAG: hypothetical protein JJ992_27165, partial [Planctomycetes bacterium]|nr:hypothetical protein [Planctomycetota bacterium]